MTVTVHQLRYHARGHTWVFTYNQDRIGDLARVCLARQAQCPDCWQPDDTAEVLRAATMARLAVPDEPVMITVPSRAGVASNAGRTKAHRALSHAAAERGPIRRFAQLMGVKSICE